MTAGFAWADSSRREHSEVILGKKTAKLAPPDYRIDSHCRREKAKPTGSEAVLRVWGRQARLTATGLVYSLKGLVAPGICLVKTEN